MSYFSQSPDRKEFAPYYSHHRGPHSVSSESTSPSPSSLSAATTPSVTPSGGPSLSSSAAAAAAAAAAAERRKTPSSWDPNDDVVLRHLKEQLKLGWKEIASHFPNRTTNACQFRWRRLMSGTLRNSPVGGSGSGVGTPTVSSVHSPPQSAGSPSPYPVSPALSTLLSQEEQKQRPSTLPQQIQQHQPANGGGPPQGLGFGTSLPQLSPKSQLPPIVQKTGDAAISSAAHLSSNGQFHSKLYEQLHGPEAATGAKPHPHQPHQPPQARPWSGDEDELLVSRKDLRPEELSLLLSPRTEVEIRTRMEYLRSQGRIFPPSPSSPPSLTPSVTSSSVSTVSSIQAPTSPPLFRRPSKVFTGLRLPTPVPQRPHSNSNPSPAGSGSAFFATSPALNVSL